LKHLRLILQILGCLLIGGYVALIFALDNSRVQQFIASKTADALEETLGSKVEIGSVEVGLFNAVELHDVTLYDKRDSLLLTSELIYGKISITPLFRGKIFLRNISLLDGIINLYKPSPYEDINAKFVFDAFKSNKKEKKPLNLEINSLILRRCQLSYDELYKEYSSDGRFNVHHLKVYDLSANVSLKELTDNNLNLRVRQLSLKEQSGFKLNDLRLHLIADRKHADINGLHIELPESRIDQKKLTADYNFKDFKTFTRSLILNGDFSDIHLSTNDFTAFVPKLNGLDESLDVKGHISLSPEKVQIRNLTITDQDKALGFAGNLALERDNSSVSTTKGDITKLTIEQRIINSVFENVLNRKVPEQLAALGTINFKGTTQINNKKEGFINGDITSSVGNLHTEASRIGQQILFDVNSSDFNPSLLVKKEIIPSLVDFAVKGKTLITRNANGKGFNIGNSNADIEIKSLVVNGEHYDNLHALADYSNRMATVHVTSDNDAARLKATVSGLLASAKPFASLPTNIKVNIDVEHFSPTKLHLTDKFGNCSLAFNADAELNSVDIKDLAANVNLTNFTLCGDGKSEEPFCLKNLKINVNPVVEGNHIRLRSDFADLEYDGPIDPKELKKIAIRTINKIQKGVFRDSEIQEPRFNNNDERISLALAIRDTKPLKRLLGINISNTGVIQANGYLSHDGNNLSLTASAPGLSFGKFSLRDLSVFARSNNGAFNLLGKVSKALSKGDLIAEFTAVNKDGKILSDLEWGQTQSHSFYGKVSTSTTLDLPNQDANGNWKGDFGVNTEVFPTNMCISDSIWQFTHGNIDYHNKRVVINNFGCNHHEQGIAINGIYDRQTEDTIVVDLHKVDLEYILALARLNVVEFSGHATGKAYVRQLADGSPWAEATVNVPDLHFNHAYMGNGDVTLGWDHAEKDITINGDIREEGWGYTLVNGYVDPVHKDLDLRTKSLNTQLGFINKYTEGIFADVNGRATGNCRIHGGFKTIEFEGHEVGNCEATIPVTGVTYRVSDADVDVLPDAFVFNHAVIRDMFNGVGEVSGRLAHTHIKDMRYDFKLSGTNLRLYDKPRELDMPFYATANGSGNVHIYGSPGKMNADMKISTIPGSELTYILDSPDADVSQLLTFHKQDSSEETPTLSTLPTPAVTTPAANATTTPAATSATESTTDISLYFEVDVDDQSCLHMITDDKSGDVITVYGSGPIQATYHNKSGFQMFGTYNIDHGTYGLNIPSLAQRRKFDILSGGQVSFTGDPTEADVNVKAQYVVNSASLADLNIGSAFANNTTRVNCLVNIYGPVKNMQFDLDFDLPNVSEDEKMMVHNLIASDEERTMQVLYLLGVGRFYSYNYTSATPGQSQTALMMNSLLSSTLSSQLNNIISDAIGSSNWTFGTNIQTGQMGWNDTEIEGLVSSRLLNNRLLINGNFGYSNRQAATTNFVGDFDMQYLITPKGTVSIRAYSETNDRYFTKSTLTTQGVGLQLKRDFSNFLDLFRRKNKSKQNNPIEK